MNNAVLPDKEEQDPAGRLVLLSGKDIDDATRLVRILAESAEADVVGIRDIGQPQVLTRETLIEAAHLELKKRSRRKELLPEQMFGEPGWEILLLLYVEQQGSRLHLARLSSELDLPGTTTLRWLNYLEEHTLVERDPNPIDQRSAFLRLTVKAIKALDIYFTEDVFRAA
jgi:DNA-binding MarR family transcriptional regulator